MEDISNIKLKKDDVVMLDPSSTDDPACAFKLSGSGFGCDVGSTGKIYGQYIATQWHGYIRRHDINRFANEDDIQLSEDWRDVSKAELFAAVARRKRARCNDIVHEIAVDDKGKVTKEEMRRALLQLLGEINYMAESMQQLSDDWNGKRQLPNL
tara:strand:- start:526 stop:987 length:462 start_codon:yes stop_codon:yes gene_type:complete